MTEYELMYIMKPELDAAAQKEVITKINSVIETSGGKILKTDEWGKRQLETPIGKLNQGIYCVIRYEGVSTTNAALVAHFMIVEQVLRHIIVKAETITAKAAA
jgi:small subunit ribosomal protein S6